MKKRQKKKKAKTYEEETYKFPYNFGGIIVLDMKTLRQLVALAIEVRKCAS